MGKKIKKSKSKCSPSIYKKLSSEDKLLWDELNKESVQEINNLFKETGAMNVEEIAHNLTCLAVWLFRDHKKKTNNQSHA